MKHLEAGRQAVVVIHGIGNQRPMATLRDFISNILGEKQRFFSSPNRLTDDLELRRLSVANTGTDFYEYYWANCINDPSTSELISWAFNILFCKKPSKRLAIVIPTLRILIFLCAVFTAWLVYLVILNKDKWGLDVLKTTAAGIVILFMVRLLSPLIGALLTNTIVQYIGDAMRYLTPSPQSIESRAKIRKGGLELLRKLHEQKSESDPTKPRYARIVVVGHSLGSVIAYDMLSYLWSDYNTDIRPVPPQKGLNQDALKKINEYVLKGDVDVATFQTLQAALFAEQKKVGNPWRISDFVTLGSPLTHVSLLITRDKAEFGKRKQQREFPTCPPIIDEDEKGFFYPKVFTNQNDGIKTSVNVLHHAAHFGMTKWTNMYFANDYVGGELQSHFGAGVEDVPLRAKGWFNRNLPLWSHTLYWKKNQATSFEKLKQILDIKNL
jgi:hypothetical protein